MKARLTLFSVLYLCLATFTSCAGFRGKFKENYYDFPKEKGVNARGQEINNDKVDKMVIVYNDSGEFIRVDVEGRSMKYFEHFDPIRTGESIIRKEGSFKNKWITVVWWCEDCDGKMGWTEKRLKISVPGLKDSKLTITKAMLLEKKLVKIVVYSKLGSDPYIFSCTGYPGFVMGMRDRNGRITKRKVIEVYIDYPGEMLDYTIAPILDHPTANPGKFVAHRQQYIDTDNNNAQLEGKIIPAAISVRADYSWYEPTKDGGIRKTRSYYRWW